jgi:hypothetical protein
MPLKESFIGTLTQISIDYLSFEEIWSTGEYQVASLRVRRKVEGESIRVAENVSNPSF